MPSGKMSRMVSPPIVRGVGLVKANRQVTAVVCPALTTAGDTDLTSPGTGKGVGCGGSAVGVTVGISGSDTTGGRPSTGVAVGLEPLLVAPPPLEGGREVGVGGIWAIGKLVNACTSKVSPPVKEI